jgi:hypothetical protein
MSGQEHYPFAFKIRISSLQYAQDELSDTHRWYRTIVHGLRSNKQAGYLALVQRRRLTKASKGSLKSALFLVQKINRPCQFCVTVITHLSLVDIC